jgi:RimJ/RimL family protein N-acetyltransferase
MELETLETSRLIIRPFAPSDITQVYLAALNDPSIIGLTEARHRTWNRDSATEFVRLANSTTSKIFGVFIKQTHKPIGNIRLFGIHPLHRRAELSLLFYDKSEWSKGYATEAVEAVVNYAFDVLKLHRIVADYYATNIASSRMFEKVGFVIEGVFKDHFLVGDSQFIDSVRIAIIYPAVA